MAINMWPWHEFYNWFHSFILNIFLRVFCSILALSRKVHWAKSSAILFSFPPPFLKNLFKRRTLGDYFQEKVFLVANTEHKGPTFLGFIARSRICFLVDHWTQNTNVFLVHCKKWVQLLGCYHWTQGTNVPWGSLQEVDITSWL